MITFTNSLGEYIELPDPELHDTYAKNKDFLVLTSRDGSIRTIFQKHGIMRNVLTVHLSFKNVTQVQLAAFKTFILANRNVYLTYTDYDSTEWVCFISDETVTLTNMDCNNKMSIDFVMNMWEA